MSLTGIRWTTLTETGRAVRWSKVHLTEVFEHDTLWGLTWCDRHCDGSNLRGCQEFESVRLPIEDCTCQQCWRACFSSPTPSEEAVA